VSPKKKIKSEIDSLSLAYGANILHRLENNTQEIKSKILFLLPHSGFSAHPLMTECSSNDVHKTLELSLLQKVECK
jgi:hypothetical protein